MDRVNQYFPPELWGLIFQHFDLITASKYATISQICSRALLLNPDYVNIRQYFAKNKYMLTPRSKMQQNKYSRYFSIRQFKRFIRCAP
jgi:hypothetical protein